MKFMILMIPSVYRDNRELPADFMPDPKVLEPMGRFNERLAKSVNILSLNGLKPLTAGARLAFANGKATVTDGPSVNAREVLGGYWLVEASSKEEVVKLMQDCPAEDGDIIEIRQVEEF
jgi:hypothetical protein